MKKYCKLFEKFHGRFQKKKEYFKKRIECMKEKNNLSLYQQENVLFNELEKDAGELNQYCSAAVGTETYTKETIWLKIKKFKKQYKELNELTKPLWRQWTEAFVLALGLAFVLRTVLFNIYSVPSGSAELTILVGDKVWANKMVYFFQKPQRGELVVFDDPEFKLDESSVVQKIWQKYVGLPFLGLKSGPSNWVKRIIALPGDTIEGRVEDGKSAIYLNGAKLDEHYINPFPLIRIRRMKGFIETDCSYFATILEAVGLRYMVDPHMPVCAYDPNKSFAEQEFYNLCEDIIVRNPFSGGFILIPPYTPTPKDVFGPVTVPQGKYWVMGDSRNNSHDSRYWQFLDADQIHGRASFILFSIDTSESFWLYDLIKHPIDFWTKHVRWNRFFKSLWQYQENK